MPHDLAFKSMNLIHTTILKVSGGKVGWSTGKMPVLELTTIGRKSGQERSVMLTSPVQEGDAIVVVASRGGDDQHPAWFVNLRDNPSVQVAFQGAAKRPMTARIASSAERARLWPSVTTAYKGYAGYQKRTEREIPLVFLEPS
jgi:deazaflavin-dependent oxidoreductase (nitroreductase family)